MQPRSESMIQLFTSIQEAKKLIPPSRISPHGQGDAQSASDEPGIPLDNLCYGLRSNQGREGIVPPIHPPHRGNRTDEMLPQPAAARLTDSN